MVVAVESLESEPESEPVISPLNERRYGRFQVSEELIRHNFPGTESVFHGMIVLRAERRFDIDAVEYTACGQMFDKVSLGEQAPEYRVLVTEETTPEGVSVNVSFEKWR
jgi:hypothetical protein